MLLLLFSDFIGGILNRFSKVSTRVHFLIRWNTFIREINSTLVQQKHDVNWRNLVTKMGEGSVFTGYRVCLRSLQRGISREWVCPEGVGMSRGGGYVQGMEWVCLGSGYPPPSGHGTWDTQHPQHLATTRMVSKWVICILL